MEKLIDLILEYVEPDDEITAESSLRLDCGLSSFDIMCLTNALCDQNKIELTFEEVRKCSTVQELYDLCEGKK